MVDYRKDQKSEEEEIERAVAALLNTAGAMTDVVPPKQKPRPTHGRRYGRAEKQAILAEVAAGKTDREIHEAHGVCRETLSRWQRRAERLTLSAGVATSATTIASQPDENAAPPEAHEPEQSKDRHKGYHPHWREVLSMWRSRPGLGPMQVRNQLFRGGIKINVATARKIMEENGYTPHKSAIKEVELHRYEAVRPLELVHMDFKHFYINRAKVYLLLFQDDFSRFLCGHKMTDSENVKAVIGVFEECINRYGKMQTVMTDAGSAFYCWHGINRFQRLLSEEYGVDQIRAKTPRSNGKLENVNRQIEKECLDVERYASLNEAENAIQEWIRFYNFERTHQGLPPGTVPADRFLPGWNTGAPRKENLESKGKLEQVAWKEVLKVALSRIKRAA